MSTSADSQTISRSKTAIPMPYVPWLRKLIYNIILRSLQYITRIGFYLVHSLGFREPRNYPDIIKSYPSHPTLKHRIFIPRSRKPLDDTTSKSGTVNDESPEYPLMIDIHGGGFVLMEPIINDRFNRPLSENNNMIVISLDYYKAPQNPFPTALNALTSIVASILSDDTLPFDRSKVVINGQSAGASLALGIIQDERIQGRVGGLVAVYPPLDSTFDRAESFRLFKEKGMKVAGKALPLSWIDALTAVYIPEGQDLQDPRVSPVYLAREELPKKMLVVGCEYDGLCREAEGWIRKLAFVNQKVPENLGDEWERDGLSWILVKGQDHGFDHGMGKTDKIIRDQRAEEFRRQVVGWMFKEVFN